MWISRGGMRLVWHAVAFVGCGCLGIVARITQVSAAPQHAELCTEPIESADGARNDKTAMLYGLMLSDDPHAVEREYAHKLAINDLKTVLPGGTLPGGFNGMRRPVALVICTKGRPENDSVTIRAANHLIRQVGVSAIVTQTTRQALATQQAIAASGASVLHICEGCTVLLREAMRGMGDSSLVFQAFAPRPSFSAFIHAKLPEFEAYVRELRGFDGSPRIRVALIRPDNDVFRPLAATTDETLVINGAKASLQRGTNYLHATYASLSKPSTPAEVGARIAAFRPQIIYAAVGAGPVTRLVGSDLARGI